ncbi:putative enzymatic polyprotein [Sesamum angolense]|uniref:Enzymatic polyprotein n=1 Tax=Sesamum angolense TaxID=2727404 RepID=A0AAE1T6B4_9LAMI|nr:putative enzymatic polyprotein [Sesamum angolense]
MTVSNKTMERIMRQDSNLSPYDGFRIGGIGKVLNQIGLNQRKHHIIYKVSSGKLMFDIHPRIAYNLADQDFSRVLTLHQDFKRKDLMKEGSGICTAKPGVYPKEARETLPVIAERDFSQKILILNTGIREAKIMIGEAFGTPWFRVLRCEKALNRIMPIDFRSKRGDVDAKLTHPKIQDKRKFDKVLLSFRQQGLIDSDSFYEESEEEIKNLREALEELKTLDISEESILSLENVKRLIQRNFSENPLAWWDRNKIEATPKIKEECKYEYVRYKPIQMNMEDKKDMRIIIKEHINLGLIEPGISAYSSPGFLIKMESESKKFTAFSTPQGQYIWNVLPMGLANAPQIFQRKMDNLFKDYFEFMFVYIDDILIASKNMKEHIKHLEIFSDACYKEGLVLSEKKATIAVNKIEFLGILIDEARIELQEHIVEKIRNFPDILKDKKQLQSFLGVVNFAGRGRIGGLYRRQRAHEKEYYRGRTL